MTVQEQNRQNLINFFENYLKYDPKTKTVSTDYDVKGLINAYLDDFAVLISDESGKSADAKAQLQAVKKELTQTIDSINAKVEFLKNVIIDDMNEQGETKRYTENSALTIRESEKIEVTDEAGLIDYARKAGLNSLYKERTPLISKTELKKYIKKAAPNDPVYQFANITKSKSLTIKANASDE